MAVELLQSAAFCSKVVFSRVGRPRIFYPASRGTFGYPRELSLIWTLGLGGLGRVLYPFFGIEPSSPSSFLCPFEIRKLYSISSSRVSRVSGSAMASTLFNVAALIDEITTSGRELERRSNDDARQQCLAAARSLCHALESPLDSILRLSYAEVPFQRRCDRD